MVISEDPPSIKYSPFFHPPPTAEANSLAILHLKRDSLLPVTLRETADDGYAEGAVTNTRFGSFPHTTLIGQEWGSQVRASKVDTGTRGRTGKHVGASSKQTNGDTREGIGEAIPDAERRKRKSEEGPETKGSPTKRMKQAVSGEGEAGLAKAAVEAGSGFIHVLPPTPEDWTESLDHRTQVVYMPDYSYVLQRLRVRPGSKIIEAGAGSGSFTHAAARAVYSGLPSEEPSKPETLPRLGRIYSYEYHEPRVHTLNQEIASHGLQGLVHLTHRDVCTDGFTLADSTTAPKVSAIFLDLPAPWTALRHLTRSNPQTPLNPTLPIHLCTFSPCIEQVQATILALHKASWTEIQMVEIQHHHLDVRRERVGLKEEGLRGVNASAASVEEAVSRLREVEDNQTRFHAANSASRRDMRNQASDSATVTGGAGRKGMSKQARLDSIKREVESRKIYKEGNLVTRTEPEVKTHTSYLVFAILPTEWLEADEEACMNSWPVDELMAIPEKSGKEDVGPKKSRGK